MSKPSDDFNPYAAPLTDPDLDGLGFSSDPKTPVGVGGWRDGDLLVMSEGAKLPDRCVKCNQPAEGYLLQRKLNWHEPTWYLLVIISPLLYIIVALIIRKKAIVRIPLCERHRRRRVRAIIIAWLVPLAVLFLIPAVAVGASTVFARRAVAEQVSGWSVFFCFVVMIGAIIYGVVVARVVVTKKILGRHVWLAQVDSGFLAAMPSIHEMSPVELWPVDEGNWNRKGPLF